MAKKAKKVKRQSRKPRDTSRLTRVEAMELYMQLLKDICLGIARSNARIKSPKRVLELAVDTANEMFAKWDLQRQTDWGDQ